MQPFLLFVFLAVPMVLGVDESTAVHSGPASTVTIKAGLGETSKLHKALVYNTTLNARKPKRSNVEIPLLIIRPIELKKKKPYKDHMVKIMSGGVASYGNYPEIHTSDHEVFSLEHMLPILGLEGMVFNSPKHSQFVPSKQYKPSDFHYLPQKYKEDAPIVASFVPTEAEPLPSPSPSTGYAPATNTEEQLLKIGHQALSKLEIPGSSSHSSHSSSSQEKPSFTKSEHFQGKFNHQHGQLYKAVPIAGGHPGFGPGTFVGMHNEIVKYHNKPQFYPSKPSSYKWTEHQKKPQMASPLSISTNFYYPKTIASNTEDDHQQQHQPFTYYPHQQQSTAPQVQTHVSFYIPKEIEPLPQPQPVIQQHTPSQQIHQPSLPVNTVQNGEHVEFVVPKQPSHEEPPKTYYKQKFHKQQSGGQQANFYIHKQFEYSGNPHENENNAVSEYHGSHNHTPVEHQHLPEPQPYAAPQYLPLQQTSQHQQQQQPPPALTLHQTHPQQHSHPQPQQQTFHHPISTSAHQNHWKLGRRNHHHEHVKPVVEAGNDSEQQDNLHAQSVQSIKTLKPAEKSTTEVKVEIEHISQSRMDEKQKQQQQQQQPKPQPKQQQQQQPKQQQQQPKQQQQQKETQESTTIRPTTTRAGRQG